MDLVDGDLRSAPLCRVPEQHLPSSVPAMRSAKIGASLNLAHNGANHACLCTENASHPSPPAIRGETPWLRLDRFRVVRLPFRCLSHHHHVTVGPHCRKCRCCPDRPSLAALHYSPCKTVVALLSPLQVWTGVLGLLNPARRCPFSCLAPRL